MRRPLRRPAAAPLPPQNLPCPHTLEGGFSAEMSSAAAWCPRALVPSLYSLDSVFTPAGVSQGHSIPGATRGQAGAWPALPPPPPSLLCIGSLRACPQPWAFTWEVAKPGLTFLLLKEKPAELDGAATQSGGGSARPGLEGQAGQLLDPLHVPSYRLTPLPCPRCHTHTGWSVRHHLAP